MSNSNESKVCFIGSEFCGKSALVNRIVFEEFVDVYEPTLEDSYACSLVVNLSEHYVKIIDLGGSFLTSGSFEQALSWADCFIYVYSVEDEESYLQIKDFYDIVRKVKKTQQSNSIIDIPSILIGTKVDGERRIPEELGEKLGKTLKCPFYETSSFLESISEMKWVSKNSILPSQILEELIKEKHKKMSIQQLQETHKTMKRNYSRRVLTPNSNIPERHKTSSNIKSQNLSPEFSSLSMLEELRHKWKRPISQTPVYIDFPRLVAKIEIRNGEKIVRTYKKPPVVAENKKIPRALSFRKSKVGIRELSPLRRRNQKDSKKNKKAEKEREKAQRKDLLQENPEDLIDSRVQCPHKPEWGVGVIRYVGTTKLGSGIWAGIELEKPVGNCNGSVKGVPYFVCEEKRGVFVNMKNHTLEIVFKKDSPSKYTGGEILSNYGEKWTYHPSGLLTFFGTASGKELKYSWDGQYFKPHEDSVSFGAGVWNGENATWFKKDWLIFKTSKKESTYSFRWDKEKKQFISNADETVIWEYNESDFVSPTKSGKWMPENPGVNIPFVLPIFLQMLRYVRIGSDADKEIPAEDNKNQRISSTVCKVICQINNWKFRLPISGSASVAEMMNEISRRATAKVCSIEEQLSSSREKLLIYIDCVYQAAVMGETQNVSGLLKKFIEKVHETTEQLEYAAHTQTKEEEYELLGICDQIDEFKLAIVSATIAMLKNPDISKLKEDLREVINQTSLIISKMKVKQKQFQVENLKLSKSQEYLKLDLIIKDINLDDEVVLVGLQQFTDPSQLDQKQKEYEEFLKKRMEEEKRREQEELERMKKEEEEQDQKWSAIIDSLKTENKSKAQSLRSSLALSDKKLQKPAIGDLMKSALSTLSENLGEPGSNGKDIQNKFNEFFKNNSGDTSRQLAKFLENALDEDSKLAAILKAVTQSIIATPFIRLKKSFPQSMPFEDVSGNWKIVINITQKEEIAVLHQKKGTSKDPSNSFGFEFQWELLMRFNWELTEMLEADLFVSSLRFGREFPEGKKKSVEGILEPFMCS